MKHGFKSSVADPELCVVCAYPEISHKDKAQCEACGLEANCELFPDTKHPKKMLLCAGCVQAELDTAVRVGKERELSHKVIETPQQYFNANIPALVEMRQAIDNNPQISEDKRVSEFAKQVKARLTHLQNVLIEHTKCVTETRHEIDESKIFLNHLMKEISADVQKELGLVDISYKPTGAKKTSPKVPSVKKFDKNALREVCQKFNIAGAEPIVQNIVVARKISYEAAAQLYIKMTGDE